jgi:hypothetical protein
VAGTKRNNTREEAERGNRKRKQEEVGRQKIFALEELKCDKCHVFGSPKVATFTTKV